MTPPEAPGTLATPAPHTSDAQAPASAPRRTPGSQSGSGNPMKRAFTETEDALIRTHWPNVRALNNLLDRANSSLYGRAALLGVHEPRRPAQPTGGTTGSAVIYRPGRPKRVTDALHALAETPGLTLTEYLRRKHEITHTEP